MVRIDTAVSSQTRYFSNHVLMEGNQTDIAVRFIAVVHGNKPSTIPVDHDDDDDNDDEGMSTREKRRPEVTAFF